MIYSLKKKENPEYVIIKLFKYLKIPVFPEKTIQELNIHPDYPSLLAISDVLTNFKVINHAYHIEINALHELDFPFIAHTNIREEFMVIHKFESNKVFVSDSKRTNYSISINDFSKIYNGIVLTVEKQSGNYKVDWLTFLKNMFSSFKNAFIICGLLFVISCTLFLNIEFFEGLSWHIVLDSFIKAAGIFVSILLVIQTTSGGNALINKLCGFAGSKTDCNEILLSRAGIVFEGLTWSEVGLFYYTGTLLALFISVNSVTAIQLLALINFFCLPYTIYSIYYQVIVAKKWCILCCFIQLLLWIEFIAFLPIDTELLRNGFAYPVLNDLIKLLCAMIMPILLWLIIKPILLINQSYPQLQKQIREFKYNSELFNTVLKNQPKYATSDIPSSIKMGNKEAPFTITLVTNPFCNPCAKTHHTLNNWLDERDDIQVRIVFAVDRSDDDLKIQVVQHMITLSDTMDWQLTKQALHDWYSQKDYTLWAKKYPVKVVNDNWKNLDQQWSWCQLAGVRATPTLFINGYLLPDFYQIADLKYMISDL